MNAPFRADESNKATLALMRHNDGVRQELRRQSRADATESQARADEASRYSPTTTRLASAAKAHDGAIPEPEAAMTNFSRIHAAVGELNAQRHGTTVDGLSSISNASSDTRPLVNF
jgi:hypothetical protein